MGVGFESGQVGFGLGLVSDLGSIAVQATSSSVPRRAGFLLTLPSYDQEYPQYPYHRPSWCKHKRNARELHFHSFTTSSCAILSSFLQAHGGVFGLVDSSWLLFRVFAPFSP